jgi:hypothetical protein
MTKKHFIAIAAEFAHVNKFASRDEQRQLQLLAQNLCAVFKRDNANFNEARFMTACGF